MQRQRDKDRRRILEKELSSEEKLLDQARKELAEQEAVRLGSERNYQRVLDRLEPYKKKVKLHEDNIASLKREMASAKIGRRSAAPAGPRLARPVLQSQPSCLGPVLARLSQGTVAS